jgi:hypothetical protein
MLYIQQHTVMEVGLQAGEHSPKSTTLAAPTAIFSVSFAAYASYMHDAWMLLRSCTGDQYLVYCYGAGPREDT